MATPLRLRSLGTTSYFCDPRSPWQKGAVENANGRLRRYLPSDAPAERLAASSLDGLAARLNATRRRCPGYRTPADVFNGQLGSGTDDPTAAVSHEREKQHRYPGFRPANDDHRATTAAA